MDAEEQVRYSAELGRFAPAGPPGHGEVERVRDVLVVAGDPGIEQGDASELILLPRWEGGPFDRNGRKDPEPIELGRGLRLEKLDHEEGERVLNACSPRGHFFVPVRQFGQMYSLVLDVDPGQLEQGRWTWDTERRIREAVAMSRLVLDNGYSFEYAARVFDHAGEEQQIMPAGLASPAPTACDELGTGCATARRTS
jgi:hypothetical protein